MVQLQGSQSSLNLEVLPLVCFFPPQFCDVAEVVILQKPI